MLQKVQNISIAGYQYDLPDERIAKFPLMVRDESKLLCYKDQCIEELRFTSLPDLLPQDSLMIFNNTRVIQARMHFFKESGARIEIFCLEPHTPADYAQAFQSKRSCTWRCMIGNLKKWKQGCLTLQASIDGHEIEVKAERVIDAKDADCVAFSWDSDVTFSQILECAGELPIPPYLNRATEESDKSTYQTVYSKVDGSVAAPTAGLHFTERVFARLEEKGISRAELTLHVGAGTFKPVKSLLIGEHEMHVEYIEITRGLVEDLLSGRFVVAVGTTSVRTLESLYYIGCKLHGNPALSVQELIVQQWEPYQSEYTLSAADSLQSVLDFMTAHDTDRLLTATCIMIVPGYTFRIVKGIVTNFHQASSTLLLLISAFVGEDWRTIYDYALAHDFRFLSYGDSSLLL